MWDNTFRMWETNARRRANHFKVMAEQATNSHLRRIRQEGWQIIWPSVVIKAGWRDMNFDWRHPDALMLRRRVKIYMVYVTAQLWRPDT